MGQWTVTTRVVVSTETREEALELVEGSTLPNTKYAIETESGRSDKRAVGIVMGLMPLLPLWSMLEVAGFPNIPRMLLGLT